MLAIRHTDRRHDHVHLVFGVTRYDGRAVPDRFERMRFQRVVQEVAVQYGFERVQYSEKTRPHTTEYWRNVHGDRLLESVKAAWAEPTAKAFQDHLIRDGVEPVYHIRRSDGFLQGLKFRYQGRWVKARALGKQYAAAAFRKHFRIGPQDVQGMLCQNQKLGERHDPVVFKVSGAEGRDLPRGTAYRVSVDSIDIVPALPYTSKTPPVRLPADFNAYVKRLGEPYLDPAFIDKLQAMKNREPTWLVAYVERTLHPQLRDDPLAAKACRVMGHHLLRQPERNPALILQLAQADPDPRFVPLLERLYLQFEPARFLASFEENPERYARLMTSIAKLRSEITFAELRHTPVTLENCAPGSGGSSPAPAPDERARFHRHRFAAGAKSWWPLSGVISRSISPRIATAGSGSSTTQDRSSRAWWAPKTTQRALAKMRSPVRGLVATFARHLRIPYAGLVMLPATLVATQIRRTLTRATETALDFDKHQKTLFRLAQGRVLSTVILHRDVLTR